MNLLLICRGDPLATSAGTEIFVNNLAIELSKMGHKVDLIYGVSDGASFYGGANNMTMYGLRLIRIPYVRAFDFRRKCLKSVKDLSVKSSFDAIIFFGAGTFAGYVFNKIKCMAKRPLLTYYAMDSMVAEYERKKLILKSRGVIPKLKSWLWYTFLTKSDMSSCKYSDLILASSKDTARSLGLFYGVSPERIKVLYEGVPDDFAAGVELKESDTLTLLHISGDPVRKGTRFFLEAVKFLDLKYGLQVKAVITRADQYCLNLAKELQVDVDLYKNVPAADLKRLYASCTCLVAPSLSEGFGLPVIEAAMFGKPTIATNVGSLPELINDGVNGFIVPMADSLATAERIHRLFSDDVLKRRISEAARKKSKRYKISSVAKRLVHILEQYIHLL